MLAVAGTVVAGGVAAAALLAPGGGESVVRCDLNATTVDFDRRLARAKPGQTLCLASGDYGSLGDASGITKRSPGVTIREQDGATATLFLELRSTPVAQWLILDGLTIVGGEVSAPANHITIRNAAFTATTAFFTGAGPDDNNACSECPAMENQDILIERSTFNGISPGDGPEGRVQTVGSASSDTPTGLVIRNSEFAGGRSDGVQVAGHRPVTITGNRFRRIRQGPNPTDPHSDCIQILGTRAVITNNSFDGCSQGIVQFDGGGDTTIAGNVFDAIDADAPIVLGGDSNSVIEHNTLRTGRIDLTSKEGQASTGTVVRSNIAPGGVVLGNDVGGDATPAVDDYQLCDGGCAGAHSVAGAAAYVGGPDPDTRAGFALASGSPGRNAAHDGTDIGANP
jgi:Right handed beta helix region